MKSLIQKTEIKKSAIHRWGVFAMQDIGKGEIIEQCPYLLTTLDSKTEMSDYLFAYSRSKGMIILGYGSLYNHSAENNCNYVHDAEKKLIEFVAAKNIKAGEEISINYGEQYFSDRGIRIIKK